MANTHAKIAKVTKFRSLSRIWAGIRTVQRSNLQQLDSTDAQIAGRNVGPNWFDHEPSQLSGPRGCPRLVSINQSIHQSINQSINIFYVLGGQLGPNRQEVQFSEFIQTRFASYMQSIP